MVPITSNGSYAKVEEKNLAWVDVAHVCMCDC